MNTHRIIRFCSLIFIFSLSLNVGLRAQTIEEVKKLINNENYSQAVAKCDEMLRANPKKAEPNFFKGLALYKQATAEDATPAQKTAYLGQAKGAFDAGYEKNKNYPYNLVGQGLIDIQENRIDAANAKFKQADELAASDALVFVEMANGLIDYVNSPTANKDKKATAINDATTYLTKAEAKDKTKADVYLGLGDCYAAKRVYDLAITNYDRAAKLEPANARPHYASGRLYEKQNKLNEAIASMKKAIEIDPKYAPAYKRLVEIAFRAGQYDYAKMQAKKYRELVGNDKQARVRYAQLMYFTQNYPEAVTEFTSVVKDTNSYDIYRLLGYSLCETKQYAESIKYMDLMFKLTQPSEIITKDYRYYGIDLAMTGQVDKGEENIKKALAADPAAIEIYKDLYNEFFKAKDYPNAARFVSKYLESPAPGADPITEEFNYGWMLLYQLKEPQKALDVLTRTTTRHPELIDAWAYMADAASQLDPDSKQGKAKPYYENILVQIAKADQTKWDDKKKERYKKKQALAYTYLASYYYIVAPDKAKSLAFANRALEVNPEDVNAKKISAGLTGEKVTPATINDAELGK